MTFHVTQRPTRPDGHVRTVSCPGTLGPRRRVGMDVLLDDELTRQTDVLVALGYPEHGARTEAEALASPLRARLGDEVGRRNPSGRRSCWSRAARVLPVSGAGADAPARRPAGHAEPALRRRRHLPRRSSTSPTAPVYAVVGVERGEEFCGVRPAEAAVSIADRGRTHADHGGGAGLPARRARRPWRRTSASTPAPRAAPTGGCRRCGSPTGRRTWAGAGSTTTTPGWASPRPSGRVTSLLPEVTRR